MTDSRRRARRRSRRTRARRGRRNAADCCIGTAARSRGDPPARNVHESRDALSGVPRGSFRSDPRSRVRSGLEVVGAYHSHPCGRPRPSAADRDEAHGEGFTYVIAGTRRLRRAVAAARTRRRGARWRAPRRVRRAHRSHPRSVAHRGTLDRRVAPGRGELRPGAARPTALSACELVPILAARSKEPTSPPRLTRRSSPRRSPVTSMPRARSSAAISAPSST